MSRLNTTDRWMILGAMVALVAAVVGINVQPGHRATLILRPAGCTALAQAVISTTPLAGGMCSYTGSVSSAMLNTAIYHNGIKLVVDGHEIVAEQDP